MTTAPLETTEYIVAFIDILGATEMIKEDQDKYLNLIHESYQATLSFVERNHNNHNIPMVHKIFSDNIVLALPVEDDIGMPFLFVTAFSALLQFRFAMNNILVRGGITKGKFYHDDVMVWGTALVDAANLEKKALYPRIIIDQQLILDLIIEDTPAKRFWHMWHRKTMGSMHYICQDTARYNYSYYVNYLKNQTFSDIPTTLRILLQHANSNLKKYANNHRILKKHQWHKEKLVAKKKELELLHKAGTKP